MNVFPWMNRHKGCIPGWASFDGVVRTQCDLSGVSPQWSDAAFAHSQRAESRRVQTCTGRFMSDANCGLCFKWFQVRGVITVAFEDIRLKQQTITSVNFYHLTWSVMLFYVNISVHLRTFFGYNWILQKCSYFFQCPLCVTVRRAGAVGDWKSMASLCWENGNCKRCLLKDEKVVLLTTSN